MTNLNNLQEIFNSLQNLGFEAVLNDGFIAVKIGTSENPFTAVLNISGDNNLAVTCQITTLGRIKNQQEFFLACLDANTLTRFQPFAFGIITNNDADDDNHNNWPIVLTDTVPLGDFQESELESAMDSLLSALLGTREILAVGCGELRVATADGNKPIIRKTTGGTVGVNNEDNNEDDITDLVIVGAAILASTFDETFENTTEEHVHSSTCGCTAGNENNEDNNENREPVTSSVTTEDTSSSSDSSSYDSGSDDSGGSDD